MTEGSATTALTNAGVKVITVSIDSGAGLDADPTVDAVPYSLACPVGGAAGQAQRITAATGGAELTGVDPDDVADAILSGLAALDVTVSPSVVCDPGRVAVVRRPRPDRDERHGRHLHRDGVRGAGRDARLHAALHRRLVARRRVARRWKPSARQPISH